MKRILFSPPARPEQFNRFQPGHHGRKLVYVRRAGKPSRFQLPVLHSAIWNEKPVLFHRIENRAGIDLRRKKITNKDYLRNRVLAGGRADALHLADPVRY